MSDSTEPSKHGGHGRPATEEDDIPTAKIAWVGIGALVIFVAASVVATLVLMHSRREYWPEGPPPVSTEAGQRTIGLTEQVQFENQTAVEETEGPARKRLHAYGWVDQPRGLIHLPIERAMELTAQGVKP
jgi:hypothetical protein